MKYETIYIYSNETGQQVDHYAGSDNADCERWANEHWGSNDYHWSYVDVPRSNAVPFMPTHVITRENGDQIEVQLVDGAAYTRTEWDATDQADYERQDNGAWTFQGEPFAGTIEEKR